MTWSVGRITFAAPLKPITVDHGSKMLATFYTIPDLLRLLRLSRSAFHDKRRRGLLPFLEELKPRIGRPRYRADLVDRYLAGDWGKSRFLRKGA